MSMTCEDDNPETACIFRNESLDTVSIVVSREYPDSLYPMHPYRIHYSISPGEYCGIQVDYNDWSNNNFVLQLFVYDYNIPRLGTYLRAKHLEMAYYKLTKEDIKAMGGVVTYPPQDINK